MNQDLPHCRQISYQLSHKGSPRILEWVAMPSSVQPLQLPVLYSICQKIWKTQQWPQDWKRSVFIPIPKKGNAKEFSNYCTIALISGASKVVFKILPVRLQQYMNCEYLDIQAGFWKGRGTRDKVADIQWGTEKAREFRKNIYYCFIDYSKTFDCMDYNKLEIS